MRHVKRHTLATAVLLTVLSTATACSSDSDDSTGDTMTLSGNCSITDHSLSPKAVVSESMVEKLLGSDDWTAKRGLSISPQGTLEKAFVGSCAITPVSDKDDERLRVSIVPKSEPAYAEAQRVLASGTGKDTAFTKVAEDTYVTPDVTGDSDGNRLKGAKGVKVTPDYAVVVEILHPAEGVDAMKEAGPTVQAVADNLAHLG